MRSASLREGDPVKLLLVSEEGMLKKKQRCKQEIIDGCSLAVWHRVKREETGFLEELILKI